MPAATAPDGPTTARMSSRVTRPPIPVPRICVMSMLCSFAILRTRGDERCRIASPTLSSRRGPLAALGAGDDDADDGAAGDAARGAGAGADVAEGAPSAWGAAFGADTAGAGAEAVLTGCGAAAGVAA